MKIIHDEINETTLIFTGQQDCPKWGTVSGTSMGAAIFPFDVGHFAIYTDAPGNGCTTPHVFGAVYPRNSYGLPDFDKQPEHKELKILSVKVEDRLKSQSIMIEVKNLTGEVVNPRYIFVFKEEDK